MFYHLSPLEIFRQILLKYGNESRQFHHLYATFNPVEICILALQIICSDNTRDLSIKVLFI